MFSRLAINDNYSKIDFPIFAPVFKPQISVEQQILCFGNVSTRSRNICTITINSLGEAGVKWKAVEYIYEKDEVVEAAECHLSATEGILCHKGSVCDLNYILCTKVYFLEHLFSKN